MIRLLPLMGLLVVLAGFAFGEEPQWGTIKGRVLWAGETIPEREVINVIADKKVCLAKGPILSEEFVIDKKSKGVKWVMVWLVDAQDDKAKIPIHPDLKKFPEKVTFDAPCCVFEPHVLGVREGQTVVFKNSATIPHNANPIGGNKNPNLSMIVPAGKALEIENWRASVNPVIVPCSIHPWMKMYIRVFDHPYFAVTDEQGNFEIKNAPVGDFRLVVWHESNGWVVGDKTGVPVKITPGKVTDLPVAMKPKP